VLQPGHDAVRFCGDYSRTNQLNTCELLRCTHVHHEVPCGTQHDRDGDHVYQASKADDIVQSVDEPATVHVSL